MNQVGTNSTTTIALDESIATIVIEVSTKIVKPIGKLPTFGNAAPAISIESQVHDWGRIEEDR
jgi:hypothetical protein